MSGFLHFITRFMKDKNMLGNVLDVEDGTMPIIKKDIICMSG